MTHIDAWTGEEIPGKAIILNTTEGPELIDAAHLQGDREHSDVAGLRDRVAALEDLVQQLVDGQGDAEPTPEAKTTTAKATTAKAAAK